MQVEEVASAEGGRGNRGHRNDLGALEEVKGFSRP